MRIENIYEERIFAKGLTVIFAIATMGFLLILLFQIIVGYTDTRPAANWFFFSMFLLFFGLTVNFSTPNIKITSQYISVGYGIFKNNIPLENIVDCYLDEASTIRYGGWGIRIGSVKGKLKLVYNIIGVLRVMLSLNKGKFKEFVFSTNNPQKVIKIVRQELNILNIEYIQI